ncbi:MAG: Vi polysaccharide biosynthesis UDP-N-acetylglucosamine C-6 dehydrogenase TviB [Gammaproteobacteria bacterium]|nr:Vi polysaccharide biosynthesis UDP-N-acetylglucosamine C-6 dehydrogenase TviB [Gammaproteobacteria bacterium]
MLKIEDAKVGIIGLGYVGLPLAVEFGKLMPTVGFDINTARIAELKSGKDSTLEMDAIELSESLYLSYSDQLEELKTCNVYIVTVPTPIDRYKRPDLTPLESASRMLGEVIGVDDVTIFESTVYPGATEEVCVPIIESVSGLIFNKDFYVGYSPERINPGDKEHRVSNILKITSGSTPEAADFVDTLYKKIIKAGTYKTSSIRVAEAAKAIENTQRDVNIALVNELALIFNRLDIDTAEVLEAAGTKWNFLPFRPGLVGGHCIGIDPYYLTHKAQEIGYHPEVILAGRRINDSMGIYVAGQVLKTMNKARLQICDARVLIMGLTFKENCPDIRNTRVIDVIDELKLSNTIVDVYDPWVDPAEVDHEYNVNLVDEPEAGVYDAIVLAVAHQRFRDLGVDGIRAFGKPECILYDVKHVLPAVDVDGRL